MTSAFVWRSHCCVVAYNFWEEGIIAKVVKFQSRMFSKGQCDFKSQ